VHVGCPAGRGRADRVFTEELYGAKVPKEREAAEGRGHQSQRFVQVTARSIPTLQGGVPRSERQRKGDVQRMAEMRGETKKQDEGERGVEKIVCGKASKPYLPSEVCPKSIACRWEKSENEPNERKK